MKVFSIEGWGNYGGGLAIVAAENELQAKEVGGSIRDIHWQTDYAKGDTAELQGVQYHGTPCVITHFETGE